MVYGYYWFTIFILFGEMIHYSLWVLLIRTKLSLMIHSEPKHSCHLKPEHFSGLTLYFLLQRWNCEKKKKKFPFTDQNLLYFVQLPIVGMLLLLLLRYMLKPILTQD